MTKEEILAVLTKQRFYDFYNGDFEDWLVGDEDALTTEEILAEIERLFYVKV